MAGTTALLLSASFGLETCRQFSELLRVPVAAFLTLHDESSEVSDSALDRVDRALATDALRCLMDIVALPDPPTAKDSAALRRWATRELSELRRLVAAAEKALTGDDVELANTARAIRDAADEFVLSLLAYELVHSDD